MLVTPRSMWISRSLLSRSPLVASIKCDVVLKNKKAALSSGLACRFISNSRTGTLMISTPPRSSCSLVVRRHGNSYSYPSRLSYPLVCARAYTGEGGPGRPQRPAGAGRAALGAAAFAAMTGKAKFLLTGLKLFKFTPVLSMIGTSLTYSLFFGWPYSVGMVGLIAVHEAGHALAMRNYGIPFSPFVMVPFMGAVIVGGPPKDAYQDAVVGIAGPITGSLGAAAVGVAAHTMDSQLLYALTDFGIMINLFNLMPIGSMDGGRIAGAIHPALQGLGLAGGAGLLYTGAIGNPIFYLIMASGTYSAGRRLLGYDPNPPGFYRVPLHKKLGMSAAYAALIGALIAGSAVNNVNKRSPRQLGYRGTGLDEKIERLLDDGENNDGDWGGTSFRTY